MELNFSCLFYWHLDGHDFNSARKAKNQDIFNKLLLWTCNDECIYQCLWRTTHSFLARKWRVPQFFGKVQTELNIQFTRHIFFTRKYFINNYFIMTIVAIQTTVWYPRTSIGYFLIIQFDCTLENDSQISA